VSEPSFFPPVPPAGSIDAVDVAPAATRPVWAGPPQDELPGAVALAPVIGRSATTVVSLEVVGCYSTGIVLDLTIRVRERERISRGHLYEALSVHHGRGHLGLLLPPGGLRFGVQFADGRRVTSLEDGPWSDLPSDVAPVEWTPSGLVVDGMDRPRVYGNTWRRALWLWPVPPPGDLTVACLWPDRDIAETRTVVPTGPVLVACRGVRRLWESCEEPSGI